MFDNKYDVALSMMLQGEEGISKRIQQFMDKMPEKLIKKIKSGKEEATCSNEGKRWDVYDDGDGLSIAVGSVNNLNKDYMTIHLRKIEDRKVNELLPCFGEIPVGSVTFYLYNPDNKRQKPLQITFDAVIRRTNDRFYISFATRTNPFISENKDVIEKNGFMDLFEEQIRKGTSVVDMTKVYGYRATKK